MNIENIPKTLISSIVKNGKAVATVAVAGIATLALVDVVKEIRK